MEKMEITFEIKDPTNPANKKMINLTSDLTYQINDFITSGSLFLLERDTFAVSLKCEYNGGSVNKYCLFVKDKVNGIFTYIDLENKYDFKYGSPKVTYFTQESGSLDSKDCGRLGYNGIFNNLDKEKMADIIYKRVKKLKNFNYSSNLRKDSEITINNTQYELPSTLFNQLTIQNFDAIKNLPKRIDISFFQAISSIEIKNLFSITKEEQETIELLTDAKTPEYLKSDYKIPTSIQKIRKIFKI